MTDLQGKDFVAKVRLSTFDDQTLALPGETCERVPAPTSEKIAPEDRTQSYALTLLLASGLIDPKPVDGAEPVAEAPAANEGEA